MQVAGFSIEPMIAVTPNPVTGIALVKRF